MRPLTIVICLLALLASAGCKHSAPVENTPTTAETQAPKTAAPQTEWVSERVLEAKNRLSESPAGELLWRSIETHGGLEKWFANGPIYFRFNYRPLGDSPYRDTYQTVDTWSSRARHQVADDQNVEFGWDGKDAWISPPDAELTTNARFWALTPYYFIGMPFVLADPGVFLKNEGTTELHGRPHDVLRATFGENVGDSPDDYYVIYLDAETGHVGGLRYIVSYRGFFPDGNHSPEKLMVYEGEQTVDGITLAKQYSTYSWDIENSERGEKVTHTELTDLEFTLDSFFEAPADAKILEDK